MPARGTRWHTGRDAGMLAAMSHDAATPDETREADDALADAYRTDGLALPAALAARLVPLALDDETRAFVRDAGRGRHGALKGAVHALLGRAMSDFDVNGWLGTYPLFLLSSAQWAAVLEGTGDGALLDVGAGSGGVTARFAARFRRVVATETSKPMARRLAARFETHALDLASEGLPPGAAPEAGFDVVTCLNVLDRCAKPVTLLRHVVALARPGGHVVVATPLPFDPFVFRGGATDAPAEDLGVRGATYAEALASLAAVLEGAGLAVERVARAPYLSGGDARRALYRLDAAVLTCRRRS